MDEIITNVDSPNASKNTNDTTNTKVNVENENDGFAIVAKIKLLPRTEQAANLMATMNAYRDACEYVSKYVFNKKTLTLTVINKDMYHVLRDKFGLKSQMAQSVIRTVIAKYKTVLTNEGQLIKVNFRKPQYDLVFGRDYSVFDDYFSLNTLKGREKVPFLTKGMEKYFEKVDEFGGAKLVYKKKKWYLHISVKVNVENISQFTKLIGIDRGINFVITTYDGKKTKFVSGKAIKHKRGHYKKLRQDLQRRQTTSARRRLKAIGNRENRWMQDVNHCVSKALVTNNPEGTLFVLEDLTSVRNATEKVQIKDRYVSVSWAFFDLETKLMYKAKMHNQKVIKVAPQYTSQRCPICGHIESSNRNKKTHTFHCKQCGFTTNDDRVGAMNLYDLGIDFQNGNPVPKITAEKQNCG